MTKLADTIEPLINSANSSAILIHILRDRTALITLSFDKSDQSHLLVLDNVTSRAIRHGGSLKTDSRASLDLISPYLAKRMTGAFNLPL